MELSLLPVIQPIEADKVLSNKKGIYFWFTKDANRLVYVGIALGAGGLRKRIVSQHLNPAYLEFRPEKHTDKDWFQSENAINRKSRDGKTIRCGIDKSAFRKSIGRKLKLKPGMYTVQYITENLYLKVFESNDLNSVKACEIELIKKYNPEFNTSHKPKE